MLRVQFINQRFYKQMGNQKSIQNTLQEGTFACNSYTTKNGNLVWAAAMQLAWNQLRNKFAAQKPLKLITNQPASLQTIKNFNMGLFTIKDIDDKCIYVKSGYGQHTVQTINQQVKAKFPKKTIAPLQDKLQDTDIISYAYLFKELVFEVQFGAIKQKDFKFNGKAVKSFYGKNAQQNKQVMVHYYKNREQFMAEIRGKQNKDSLFLIKDHNIKTVEQALVATIKKVHKQPPTLKKNDKFEMPVINLDIKSQYTQLIGLPFQNQELRKYFIRDMTEILKLNIDENGARVENEAKIVATRSMSMQQDPKQIILDTSFWVVMKELGKKPYLCVLINNPEDKQ